MFTIVAVDPDECASDRVQVPPALVKLEFAPVVAYDLAVTVPVVPLT